jgi:hypothetical protein
MQHNDRWAAITGIQSTNDMDDLHGGTDGSISVAQESGN